MTKNIQSNQAFKGVCGFVKSRILSFKYAFKGIWYVLKTQKNAWLHLVATVLVLLVCSFLLLSRIEWALILLAIGLVWISETMNTSIENVVNLSEPDRHPLARVAKDVAAGAVLIASLLAVLIGLLVMVPAFWRLVQVLM